LVNLRAQLLRLVGVQGGMSVAGETHGFFEYSGRVYVDSSVDAAGAEALRPRVARFDDGRQVAGGGDQPGGFRALKVDVGVAEFFVPADADGVVVRELDEG
jgi:hypothetical protein